MLIAGQGLQYCWFLDANIHNSDYQYVDMQNNDFKKADFQDPHSQDVLLPVVDSLDDGRDLWDGGGQGWGLRLPHGPGLLQCQCLPIP